MNKIFQVVAYIAIGLAIGLMLLFGFWMLYPYKPIVFNNVPFPVNKDSYKPNDILIYSVDYCKNTDLNPIVTRYFVDGIIYMTSSNPAVPKPKGCGKLDVQTAIPSSMTKGNYLLKITYEYQMNPIRKVSATAVTERFDVTE